jgi:mRNA interferase RelE/StbE
VKTIEYRPRAQRALRKYTSRADRLIAKITAYARDPGSQANNVKQLKGGEGSLRLRVGDFRVIFTEDKDALLILDIGPRGSVYD